MEQFQSVGVSIEEFQRTAIGKNIVVLPSSEKEEKEEEMSITDINAKKLDYLINNSFPEVFENYEKACDNLIKETTECKHQTNHAEQRIEELT